MIARAKQPAPKVVNPSYLGPEIAWWIRTHPGSSARFTPRRLQLDDGQGNLKTYATVAAAAAACA
jgi:hypothetical protein